MAIELDRPTRIRLRWRGGPVRSITTRRPFPAVASVVRLLLVGAAIGVLIVTGTGLASIAFVGVLALGAALSSWDR